jgi:GAF domain-containing protein
MSDYAALLDRVRGILTDDIRRESRLQAIAALLHENLQSYDCVAFFTLDPEHRRQLHIGPQAGAGLDPGDLVVGQGICGQVVERGITIVVDDVAEELNYVPGHAKTRSEIVLPIFRSGQAVAVLDVNSFEYARFASDDRLFLEEVCLLLTDQV